MRKRNDACGESPPSKRCFKKSRGKALSKKFVIVSEPSIDREQTRLLEGRSSIEREALADANDRLSELQSQFTHQSDELETSIEKGRKATEKADKA
ncbi:hypothetical protein HAX54_048465, partial [Datura stramonium]|nr:hypothetical protein [Datura stramonium]